MIIVFLWQLWILRTKANLETHVNTMISMDCVGRVVFCLSYFYKAWILTLSPLLGLSNLPHPIHCFLAGILNYVLGIGIIIFNLLTNVLRYVDLKDFQLPNCLVKASSSILWMYYRLERFSIT